MSNGRRLFDSFAGCLIGFAPYIVGVLVGTAVLRLMRSLDFHPVVVWTTAVPVGLWTFQLVYILLKRIGENHEN